MKRVRNLKRNKKHQNVAKKYGQIRIVVFESTDEFETYAKEAEVIADAGTYHFADPTNSFACNFSLGGIGSSFGFKLTAEARRKIGDRTRGKPNPTLSRLLKGQPSKLIGRKRPNISAALSGRSRPDISIALQGKVQSVEHRSNVAFSKRSPVIQKIVDNIDDIMTKISRGDCEKEIASSFGVTRAKLRQTIMRFKKLNNLL